MVSLWRKYKNASKRKRQALQSLVAGIVFFGILYASTDVFSIRLCLFYRLFGVECFGCGLTSGFIAILHFEFLKSFQYHVLALPLFVCIIFYSTLCIVDILFEKEYLYIVEQYLAKPVMYVIYISILMIAMILNTLI